ncbi:hypothetical protein AOZ06_04435 [Kibdelosporangium phytohabitans]|uniref:Peptidase C60 n=1 Tax=Kibdelosporangium phytohabitans TaxID=860235 RepID=A0A0N9HSM0_9PSEU|nr:hypothetical protein AOZ06_04435 [Kibdelosporangium phytohabitans]
MVAIVLGISGGSLIWAGVTWRSGQAPVAPAGSVPAPVVIPQASSAAAAPPITPGATIPMPRSVPESVRIPSIGVHSKLLTLGLNPDRTVEDPADFGMAGWYAYGPTPGEAGASVILGHIDSFRGPAVFYRLAALNPGDQVLVQRSDGTTATFTVDARRQYPKSQFPAAEVYGAVGHAGLRLVTCGGRFDRKARSYLDNVVVYAHLTATA